MKQVLVETVSTFRERYVLEVPDDVDNIHGLDTVTCEEAETFSSIHLGEHIVSYREIDDEEMMTLYLENNRDYGGWNINTVKEVLVTPWPLNAAGEK